ncbi:hypothetical protein CKO28_01055 [Rhodovibrio sodomensis]|uniref:Uncharacterized protein n=1 Tax=Rhodovibrio sodomensis TaxID=1088 RepID=A0ABS1D8A1_9PROT|nr:hypothetical protein [Rhodovibrio sodomensis]MBK1666631.1 hypothetical protein [Rhodovibrio sodomensis]
MSAPASEVHDVYMNLHRGGLSVRAVKGPQRGRVQAWTPTAIVHEAVFRVQAGGQRRARHEGQRNVHAFVRGRVELRGCVLKHLLSPSTVRVRYNPFELDWFSAPDGRQIASADLVALHGSYMIAVNPVYRTVTET